MHDVPDAGSVGASPFDVDHAPGIVESLSCTLSGVCRRTLRSTHGVMTCPSSKISAILGAFTTAGRPAFAGQPACDLVERFEQVDRAAGPVVAAAVESAQRLAQARAEQRPYLRLGRLVLRLPRRCGREERCAEDRLGDGVAGCPGKRGGVARRGRVDRLAEAAKRIAAHDRHSGGHSGPGRTGRRTGA